MKVLEEAIRLKRAGRFSGALETIESERSLGRDTLATQLLTLELLERVGRHRQALTLVQQLSKSKGLSRVQSGMVEYIFGRIRLEAGDTEAAIGHFHRAISLAEGH